GDVRADAEREHRYNANGESDVPPQCTQRLSYIPYQVIDQRDAPRVPALVLTPLDTAERAQRCAPGLIRGHACRDVLLGLSLEVIAELLVELLLDLAASQKSAQAHAYYIRPLLDTHRLGFLQCHDARDRRGEPKPVLGLFS